MQDGELPEQNDQLLMEDGDRPIADNELLVAGVCKLVIAG
jgi:hypothetical protein